jgi:hypothetical protein
LVSAANKNFGDENISNKLNSFKLAVRFSDFAYGDIFPMIVRKMLYRGLREREPATTNLCRTIISCHSKSGK